MRKILFLLVVLLGLPLAAQQPTPEQLNLVMRSNTLQRTFKQEPDGGIAMALQHVKAEPKNPFAYLVLSEIYLTAGKSKEAFKTLKEGFKHAGKGMTFERGILTSFEVDYLLKAGDTLSACKSLEHSLKLDPNHAWCNVRYAEISEQQGKIDCARRHFHRAVQSGVLKNRMALADFEFRQNNLSAAIAQYDSVRSVDPLNRDLVERLPRALMAAKQFDRALPLVFDHVGSTNALYSSLISLRILYHHQPEKVMAELRNRHIERPKQIAWPIAEGYLHGHHGKTFEAVKCYQSAWDIEPSSRLDQLLSWGYGALAQPDRAVFHLERLPDDENNQYFTSNLPRFYFEAGQYDKALEALNAQIAENDTSAYLYGQRMGMLTIVHRDAEALADCEYLLKKEPKNLHLNLSHGRLLHYLGRKDEAQQAFEATCRLVLEKMLTDGLSDPNFRGVAPAALDFAYFYLGKHEEALNALKERLNDVHTADDLYNAACLHALMGDKEQAMTYLKRAMELGYLKIFHIKTDRDLETLHNLPEFQQLIKETHEKIKDGTLRPKAL